MDSKWHLGKFPMGNKDPDLHCIVLLVFATLSLVWGCFSAGRNGRKMFSCCHFSTIDRHCLVAAAGSGGALWCCCPITHTVPAQKTPWVLPVEQFSLTWLWAMHSGSPKPCRRSCSVHHWILCECPAMHFLLSPLPWVTLKEAKQAASTPFQEQQHSLSQMVFYYRT